MGQIDLDPASSDKANETVQASSYFTRTTNGLRRLWRGKIFLNPPFGEWPAWSAKLEKEMAAGRLKEAIVIGPPNIAAFHPLLLRGGLLLVPMTARTEFYDPSADKWIAPSFGSSFAMSGRKSDVSSTCLGRRV